MTSSPLNVLKSPALGVALGVALSIAGSGSGYAQTQKLTDDQIRTIEYHYKLDQYMVGGCILGATFGAVTGVMTLSGVSVIAAVPYISTGCSLGFLIAPTTFILHDLFADLHRHLDSHPDAGEHH